MGNGTNSKQAVPEATAASQPAPRRGVMGLIQRFGARRVFFFGAGAAFYGYFWYIQEKSTRIPEKAVIYFNLKQGMSESPMPQMFVKKPLGLWDIVSGLELAKNDPRIIGLVSNLSYGHENLAKTQEVRDAVVNFRQSDKFTVAYADGFSVFPYHLATAYEKIYMLPTGALELNGFAAQQFFVKQTLDKLGIMPQLDGRHEYKNAINVFLEEKYTGPQLEITTKMLHSMFGQFISTVSQSRAGMTDSQVPELVDRALFMGEDSVSSGLVDGLKYKDEVIDEALAHGTDVEMISLADYVARRKREVARTMKRRVHKPTIGVLFCIGNIQNDSGSFGSESVIQGIRRLTKDPNIKVMILRMDSPGGDYVASDKIRRAIEVAQKKGIKVIASCSSVAASGAYFIASQCDYIMAQPGTITGSIGVFSGKMVITEKFLQRLGMTYDETHIGQNALMDSLMHPFNDEQLKIFNGILDTIYKSFTEHVARHRKMDSQQIDSVARGRVFTGVDAQQLGLVDKLGGLRQAISLAREILGVEDTFEAGPVRDFTSVDIFDMKPTKPGERYDKDEGNQVSSTSMQLLAGLTQNPWVRRGLRVLESAQMYAQSRGVLMVDPLLL